MAYGRIVIEKFGGLQLEVDPIDVSWEDALDAVNVDLGSPGELRTRERGTELFSSAEATMGSGLRWLVPWRRSAAAEQFLGSASGAPRVRAYDAAGATLATYTTHYGRDYAVYGAPGSDAVYFSTPAGVQKWNGTAFSAPAGLASKVHPLLATTLLSNRLVMGGDPANPSRVEFSNAGAPETVDANQFVELHPGDGEALQSIVSWREYVVVFKRTRFFVFFNEGKTGDGKPKFNYRTIAAGVGVDWPVDTADRHPRGAVAAKDGVYFINQRGVWITRGDQPQMISGPVNPLIDGRGHRFCIDGEVMDWTVQPELTYARDRLFVTFRATGTGVWYQLVHFERTGEWALWELPGSNGGHSLAPRFAPSGEVEGLVYGNESATMRIRKLVYGDIVSGGQVDAFYRSGIQAHMPGMETLVRQFEVTGAGDLEIQVVPGPDPLTIDTDEYTELSLSASVDVMGHGWSRASRRAELLSWVVSTDLSGDDNWRLRRLVFHVQPREVRGITMGRDG